MLDMETIVLATPDIISVKVGSEEEKEKIVRMEKPMESVTL